MTELAEAPAVERDGAITRIPHWIGGARVEGTSGRSALSTTPPPVFRAAPSTSPRSRRSTRRYAARPRRSPPGARRRSPSAPSSSSRSESRCSTPSARTSRSSSQPNTARCSRTRWARLRAARGDRVRVRDPDAPQGRLLRAGVDRHRRVLDPPAGRRRRGHHPVQLPRDGARGCGRLRLPAATASFSSPRRRICPRQASPPSSSRRPVSRTASSTSCMATRWRSTPSSNTRASCGLVRRLDADRAVHLRDRHEARQARAGIGRSEEPHDRAPRRRHRHGCRRGRLGRLRLRGERAAWPSRCSSPSATLPIRSWRRSSSGS